MTSIKKKRIYITGFNGFPFGYAPIKRITHLSNIFSELNFFVTFININSANKSHANINLKRVGHFQNLAYLYLTSSPFKSKFFIIRNISKLFASIREICFYARSSEKADEKYIILYSRNNVFHLIRLWFIGKVFNYKIICHIGELYGYDGRSSNSIRMLNDYLFNKYSMKFSHGSIIMTHYIQSKLGFHSSKSKYIILPILVDISLFKNLETNKRLKNNYFLYCGTLDYIELIIFIINSFSELHTDNLLILILSGNNAGSLNTIKERIRQLGITDFVEIRSNIDEFELINLYSNAIALIIPFRPTIQDKARFPQKLSEYLASSRPIITNENGEIQLYLKNDENAIIVKDYDILLYTTQMYDLSTDPEKAKRIGKNGFLIAQNVFDYHNWVKKVDSFLNSISNANI